MNNPEIDKDRNKIWRNEKREFHRTDGPAIEFADGAKLWCINGKTHREDGAAIEYADGEKRWFYYDKYIDCDSQEEFERLIKLRMFW